MNKEYILKNGEALIIDDDVLINQINHYDNLDEVLKKENLIEYMEEKISDLNYEKEKVQYTLKTHKHERKWLFYMFLLGPMMFFTIFNCFDLKTFGTIFNALKNGIMAGVFFAPSMALVATLLNLYQKFSDKNLINDYNGKQAEIKFLNKEIEKTRKEINELKKDLTSTDNTSELKRIKIDFAKELKDLKEKILSYYHIGYSYKKYNKYSTNELKEIVDEKEFETIKDFLKNGPVLTKKMQ